MFFVVALHATGHRKDSRRSSARRGSHLTVPDVTAIEGFIDGNGLHLRRGKFSILEYKI